VLDQNPAHDVGGGGKEAPAVFPRMVFVRDQPQKGFVNERRRLEVVILSLSAELDLGDLP